MITYKNFKELDIQPEYQLIHCTTQSAWKVIEKNGLSRMNKDYIYFTTRLPAAGEIVPGMDAECNVFIYINVKLAIKDGLKFYTHKDVVFCPGNNYGILPSKYIKQVVFVP